MTDGLQSLGQHINRVLAEKTRPLFLEVDDDLCLLESRGDGSRYGFGKLEPGMSLDRPLAILATADPANKTPQAWRFVELPGYNYFLVLRNKLSAISMCCGYDTVGG